MGERVICDLCKHTKTCLLRFVFGNAFGWRTHKWICGTCLKEIVEKDSFDFDFDEHHGVDRIDKKDIPCKVCYPESIKKDWPSQKD